MAALTELLSHFYTMTLIFFNILLIELAVLLRSLPETLSLSLSASNSRLRPTTPAKFLGLIEAKNPTIRFSTKSSPRKKGFPTDCAVCLSEFEEGQDLRRLLCKHTFHKACLDTWLLQRVATCPLCRSKVLPDDVVAAYHQVQSLRTDLEYDGSDEEMVFLLSAVQHNTLHRFLN